MIEHGFHLPAVTERYRRTGGVDNQALQEVARDCAFLFDKKCLQFHNICKAATSLQFTRTVHRLGKSEFEFMSVLANSLHPIPDLSKGPVTIPPTAGNIKALQGKAKRIKLKVARGAGRRGAMFGELLPDRGRAPGVGCDGFNTGRRRRDVYSHDALHHPGTANHRRGRGSVGRNTKEAGLSQ